MSSLGERIKLGRKVKGFSQAKLGKIAGVAQVTIMRYESNETEQPSFQTLVNIATALETTPDYLMTGIGDMPLGESGVLNQLISIIDSLEKMNQIILLSIAKTLKAHQKVPEENKTLEKIKRILADDE